MTETQLAAKALKAGHAVAFPTETVYGLGADAENQTAVSRIYTVKDRPQDHPLIVHISSPNLLNHWAIQIPDYAIKLAKEFWPGPMTLILKRSQNAKDFITGGQESIGIRIPNHPVAKELLKEFESLGGKGVAAPSANRFGKVSPTTKKAVEEELSQYLTEDDLILEGGMSEVGIESTIIDCTHDSPSILRPGAITQSMIENSTNLKTTKANTNIRVSGSLDQHYSPRAKVILNQTPNEGDGFIALANIPTPKGAIRLAEPNDTTEYARILYSSLRLADEKNLNAVIAITPEGDELSIAIKDRLKRASN